MEHDRREGTQPGYQTQSAHTVIDEGRHRGCRLVSSSSLLHEPVIPTPLKNDHQVRPYRNGLMKPTSGYAKQMTLHIGLAASILTMSSEHEIYKTRAEEVHHNRTARHRASSPQFQPQTQLRPHNWGRQREGPSNTPE
jgi:hypothetical protein